MMTKNLFLVSSLLFFLLAGCRKHAELCSFTYSFSMESPGAFKVDFLLNPDSTYRIRQFNYFFYSAGGTKNPEVKQGKLTAEEFVRFKNLLAKSDIGKMKNAYGFDRPHTANSVMYVIQIQQKNRDKCVFINGNSTENFSADFIELINYTNKFTDAKIE